MAKQSQQTWDSVSQTRRLRLQIIILEVSQRLVHVAYLVKCAPSSSCGIMSSSMYRFLLGIDTANVYSLTGV